MGLADFFRPKHKHSDPSVRAEAIRQLGDDEAEILADIAASDDSAEVRSLAIERIDDPETLVDLVRGEVDPAVRDKVVRRAADKLRAEALAGEGRDALACLSQLSELGAASTLAEVAARARRADVRHAALGAIDDERALADLFRSASDPSLRTSAIERIDDVDVLRALGISESRKDAAYAIIDRVADRAVLEAIATRGKSRAIRARARRKLDRETQEAVVEGPGSGSSPAEDEAVREQARIHAERSQRLRRIEALSKARDVLGAQAEMAEHVAAWRSLDGDASEKLETRFEKALARFEKRVADDAARVAAAERAQSKQEASGKPEPQSEAQPAPVVKPEPVEHAEATENEADAPAREDPAEAENLAQVRAALEKEAAAAEAAADKAASSKAVERALRRAETALADATGELRSRLEAARTTLLIRARELAEADNWRRWANAPRMEALIASVEALRETPEDPALFDKLRAAQSEWKKLGAPPRERGQQMWEKFKAASDAVYALVRDQRAAARAQQAENLAEKEKLCEAAEALSESTDWVATAREIKNLQAAWRRVGPVPRKHNQAVWKRFRAACDKFFERRRPHLEEQLAEGKKSLAALTKLAEQAETAAEAENLAEAEAALKNVRDGWRKAGRAPRKEAAELRARVDAAAAKIASRRDEQRAQARAESLAKIESARTELAAAVKGDSGEAAASAAVALRAASRGVTDLSKDDLAADEKLIARAVETWPDAFLGTELDPGESQRKKEKICARIESLAPSQPTAADVTADAPPEVIAERLRTALAKNALGGAASGPDPAATVAEAKEAWLRLGPVPGQAGAALDERFRTACDRALGA